MVFVSQALADILISIHAPREGSDGIQYILHLDLARFLSTLPARGATFDIFANAGNIEFLSTLPARGATCNAV